MSFEGRSIYMIGVGGAGMSSLARYLHGAGAAVHGTDRHPGSLSALVRDGVVTPPPANGRSTCLCDGMDYVVRTAAAQATTPEVKALTGRGVPLLKYAEMLGLIMKAHRGFAVAGTHGKTTVSALIAHLLRGCDLDPSFVIGGTVPSLGGLGGARGKGDILVVEACEFDRSFLNLEPDLLVITNIEEDHLDCYRDLEDLRAAFAALIARVGGEQRVILWEGIPDREDLCCGAERQPLTFGLQSTSTLHARNVRLDGRGSSFELVFRQQSLGEFRVNQPGNHNVRNALAAVAAALEAGCDVEAVRRALPGFTGVDRRLECRGTFHDVTLYSDYAHHPTEIAAVQETLRLVHPDRRVVTVYQAHQRSRTAFFLERLAVNLARFDLTLVLETFSVRETDVDHLPDGRALSAAIAEEGGHTAFIGGLEGVADRIAGFLRRGDVLVLMGAGDIDEVAGSVVRALQRL